VIEERIKDMDAMGIDMEVLSINPYWYKADRDLAEKVCALNNQKLAELCAMAPTRFGAFASLAMQYPDMAVKQLEEAMTKFGLQGAAIGGSVLGDDFCHPKYHPVLAKAEELGATLFIHPQSTPQLESRFKGNGWLANTIGNPLDTTIAVSHLIFDGVMERNPKLKVLLAHAGGYLAHYWARMDHVYGARPDGRSVIKRKPSTYLERFYFDTITFDPGMLRNMIERFGADHVMLGTDYPYDMAEVDPLGLVSAVKRLNKDDRDLITGGNAKKLFKIKS
jgi:aminocarboxymuconate-semialdehyde decarboxylase